LQYETEPCRPDDAGYLILALYLFNIFNNVPDNPGYDDALLSDVQELAEKIIEDWGRDTDDAVVLIYAWD